MVERDEWICLATDLDWTWSYVPEDEAFPADLVGDGGIPPEAWEGWEEPYRTTFPEYVRGQDAKEAALRAVGDAVGTAARLARLPTGWRSALKLHGATLALAEFAAVIGNLRGARFGRRAAWRNVALWGALDELRHAAIPMTLYEPLVQTDRQVDWIHRFYHTNNWVAIAARHCFDELLQGSSAVDFAVGTHVVLETGFTNLQFIAMSAIAREADDPLFEHMVQSIQTDEARHAQIGLPVLERLAAADPARAQYLLDKWFWRCWRLFAVVTGFGMDYLAPLAARRQSFAEFMQEWVIEQYLAQLPALGLRRPWYWETFLDEVQGWHHRAYAAAYTYRASLWFDLPVPSPAERDWLAEKYPSSFPALRPVWERIDARWASTDPDVEFAVHGTSIIGFCDLCQVVLCAGSEHGNPAIVVEEAGVRRVFCSEPCRWIFASEPERYAGHQNLVERVLAGEAPGNLLAMLRRYMCLDPDTWGRDPTGGRLAWIERP